MLITRLSAWSTGSAAPGGQLPSKQVTFIPTERVEKVEALDLRIQQMKKIMPFVGAGAIALVSFLMGTMF